MDRPYSINVYKDEVVSWTFNRVEDNSLDQYTVLERILNIFYQESVFITKGFTLMRSNIEKGDIIVHMQYPNYSPKEVIEEVKMITSSITNSGNLILFGTTKVLTGGRSIDQDRVIEINYSLNYNELFIETYSDLWVPLGLNGEQQPELALANFTRLESVLQKIKKDIGYAEVYPEKDEEVLDGQLPQKGFRIYTPGDFDTFKNYKNRALIKKFFWSERMRNEY